MTTAEQAPGSPDDLRERISAVMPGIIDDLTRLVAIPSCAFPGFPPEPVLKMAAETVAWLHRSGMPNARLLEVPDGYPVVYGDRPAPPGAPTVLLYAHYDVQPAPPEQGWTIDPWSPTVRDGRLYGRGAADDKSGIAMHAATLQAFGDGLAVGIKVVIEGEEETDSHLEAFALANPDLFTADVYVIADGGNEQVGEPVIGVSTRGGVVLEVAVNTLEQPVHSGLFGGAAPDALLALMRMLATLHDDTGDVAVTGLAHSDWDGDDTDEQLFRRASGTLPGQPLVGTGRLSSRLWTRPAISVIGLDAPPTHGAVNALAPRAKAVVAMRIPPGADADHECQRLTEHLVAAAPWGVSVEVNPTVLWPGWSTSPNGPFVTLAREAMTEVFGKPTGVIGSGGSIPLLTTLAEINPAAEFVLWGAEDGAQANIHSADESVDLAELERAALAQTIFVARLSSDARMDQGKQS
ncbi:MAG: M20/M25/M40 family metallo-hydrolase [Actinomycetia bacterium]|nr:M20/M25/M40 family metallo-hydrolase [Actinomycetes bacterium]